MGQEVFWHSMGVCGGSEGKHERIVPIVGFHVFISDIFDETGRFIWILCIYFGCKVCFGVIFGRIAAKNPTISRKSTNIYHINWRKSNYLTT